MTMTSIEKECIIKSIKSMYQVLHPTKDLLQLSREMHQKSDIQLAFIFKHYTRKLKKEGIQRPVYSYINQELFAKVLDIMDEKRIVTKNNWNPEFQSILGLLNNSEFISSISNSEPFFNIKMLSQTSLEELLRILALCCFFQITKAKSCMAAKKTLNVSDEQEKMQINKMVLMIQENFDIKEYYLQLQSYPILSTWETKSIEDCYEDLIEMLQPFLLVSVIVNSKREKRKEI